MAKENPVLFDTYFFAIVTAECMQALPGAVSNIEKEEASRVCV